MCVCEMECMVWEGVELSASHMPLEYTMDGVIIIIIIFINTIIFVIMIIIILL